MQSRFQILPLNWWFASSFGAIRRHRRCGHFRFGALLAQLASRHQTSVLEELLRTSRLLLGRKRFLRGGSDRDSGQENDYLREFHVVRGGCLLVIQRTKKVDVSSENQKVDFVAPKIMSFGLTAKNQRLSENAIHRLALDGFFVIGVLANLLKLGAKT